MSRHLPPVLLDCIWLRTSARSEIAASRNASAFRNRAMARQMSHAAVAMAPPPPLDMDVMPVNPALSAQHGRRRRRSNSLAVRKPDALSELEKRVEALKRTVLVEETTMDIPSYGEEQLLSIYEDLLALPPAPEPSQASNQIHSAVTQEEANRITLQQVSQRLFGADAEPDSASVGRILDELQSILSRRKAAKKIEAVATSLEEHEARIGKLQILNLHEWESVVRIALAENDGENAERALKFMRRFGKVPTQDLPNEVMNFYAKKGDVHKVEDLMKKYAKGTPTEVQRHIHIKAHLISTPSTAPMPTSALSLLHHYESLAAPAPLKTYTVTIQHLLRLPTALARAQAWDLFSHMRYIAHPFPDLHLYSTMIRACASFPSSASGAAEPERALDLWHEMTVERGIEPDVRAWNAVILALARGGEREWVMEAFRMAREMVGGWRDARGRGRWEPDAGTVRALVEGAKRIGEVGRVRWLLTEVVRMAREGGGAGLDAGLMVHVFHAYAAYRPPFRRGMTRIVEGEEKDQGAEEVEPPPRPVVEGMGRGFSHLPPQSAGDVIKEVDLLFARIVDGQSSDATSTSRDPFRNVHLTSALLNAYLSVYYAHAPLTQTRALWKSLFDNHGISKHPRTYVDALERCAGKARKSEEEARVQFAKEVWLEWLGMERAWLEGGVEDVSSRAMFPRWVERMHAAMIKVITQAGALGDALVHLASFVQLYPPDTLRKAPPLPALRSTRPTLDAAKPLVRMTTAVDIPDDAVPPLLTFGDLELLHHRLAAERDREGVGYVKWVCKSYEGALRVRRERAMTGSSSAVGRS